VDEHKLKSVEVELKRFTKRVAELRKTPKTFGESWYGCKQTAAVRRASMDLTNALAELRKS